MIYKEEVKDLFSLPENYYLAQCISADFRMGAGIAVQFNRHFNIRNKLIEKYGYSFVDRWDIFEKNGSCILEGRVYNLITKRNSWSKPTYDTLRSALKCMADMVKNNPKVKYIGMPQIGCGLDKLKWDHVRIMIQEEFKYLNVEIVVCKSE